MDTNNSTLSLREYPFGLWIVGLILLGTGGYFFNKTPGQLLVVVIIGLIGLIPILTASVLTITADRASGMLTLQYRNVLFLGSKKEIPMAEISAIQVEMSHSSGSSRNSSGPSYRIVAVLKDGQIVPFRSYYSGGESGKKKKAQQLRAFLGVEGEDQTPLNMLKSGMQMVQQRFQEQQEAMTGSNEEEHVTDGIHWKVRTVTFGTQAITHWFSPDFQCVSGFLFLAQKVDGQKTVAGGMGKFLYQQSIGLYGFGSEDTPDLNSAEVLPGLNPQLEPHFSAFTSDAGVARQILNAWIAAPLADWATRYPLKQVQKPGLFGQLVVLFSPRGVYVANLGTMIPEAVDELTTLGVALVKTQGSSPSRIG
jgi:hypothetical protein